jgi:hypothetical protein
MDDGVHWNLNALAGTHTAQYELDEPPMVANWTFSVDLCHTLPKNGEIDDKEQCPQGTNGKLTKCPSRIIRLLTSYCYSVWYRTRTPPG